MSKGVQIKDLRSFQAACTSIHDDVVGQKHLIETAFGRRRLLYCDYTASGRALHTIEDYVKNEVLPMYANIHSMESAAARQSSFYREESRDIIRNYLNATHEDSVVFAGSGSTGAAGRLLEILRQCNWQLSTRDRTDGMAETRWHSFVCKACDLQLDSESAAKAHMKSPEHQAKTAQTDKPKVLLRLNAFLIDPSSHHSSFLPFKEQRDYSVEDLDIRFMTTFIKNDQSTGHLDIQNMVDILAGLAEMKSRLPPSIELNIFVLVSACSNITGVKMPVAKVSEIIHSYNAIGIWDMASALGNTKIDLNPRELTNAYIDVAFLSPHKLMGGPDTAGLLTFKKFLLQNDVPGLPGGGAVRFVSKDLQLYSLNSQEREESGTPNIVACIRTGMTFRFNSLVSLPLIVAREIEYLDFLVSSWHKEKRVHILGPLAVPQLGGVNSPGEIETTLLNCAPLLSQRKAVVSFIVKYGNKLEDEPAAREEPGVVNMQLEPSAKVKSLANRQTRGGLLLHHNFVCALLNDIFGIQARPGCACAGPLAHTLLGFDEKLTQDFADCLEETGAEVLRPGFVRISLHYSMDWDEIELIDAAVKWVAAFGWKLMPFYTFDNDTGVWTQNVVKPAKFRKWLSAMHFDTLPDRSVKLSMADEILTESGDSAPQTVTRRDPRKLAGAVCLPGMGGAIDELKNTLAQKRAQLKKAGTAQQQQAKKVDDDEAPASEPPEPPAPKPAPKSAASSSNGKVAEMKRRLSLQRTDSKPVAAKVTATRRASKPVAVAKRSDSQVSELAARFENPPKAILSMDREGETTEGPSSLPSAVANDDSENILDPELIHRMTNGSEDIPEELGDFYNAANRLIDAITNTRSGSETEQERRLANLNKRGLSPPLPAKFAHLLWFALPGDAALSLRLFDRESKKNEEALPEVAVQESQIGYPNWHGDKTAFKGRPVDAPFEVKRFSTLEQPLIKDKYTAMIVNDELLRLWTGFQYITHSSKVSPQVPVVPTPMLVHQVVLPQAGPLVLSARIEAEPPAIVQENMDEKSANPKSEDDSALLHLLCGQDTTSSDISKAQPNDDAVSNGLDRPQSGDETITGDVTEVRTSPESQTGTTQPPEETTPPPIEEPVTEPSRPIEETAEESPTEGSSTSDPTKPTSTTESHMISNLPCVSLFDDNDPSASMSSGIRSLSSSERKELLQSGRLEIPKSLRKTVGKAIQQFGMIKEGDRILVGLSGGKDSLTMLHVLRDLQVRSPVKFELAAATVNPQTPEYDPTPLVGYMESLNVPYHLLSYPIIELAKKKMQGDSLCSFCARMKRGLLYSCMKAHKYTTLALGQHLDDICESFLMSAFYNGSLNTMKANYVAAEGDLRIIRPLTLTREHDLATFAQKNQLPVIVDNCPACFSAPKERLRMKHLLAQQEYEFPNTLGCLAKALNPLMSVDRAERDLGFHSEVSEGDDLCGGMCPINRI